MVSVIIPSFNAEKFLEETLTSVINQTYKDWEIIIVNDGSTDGTKKVVSNYLDNPKIKLLDQKNQGVSIARNNGANVAEGKYLSFLDADDIWAPNFLSETVSALEKNEKAVFVNCDAKCINEESHEINLAYYGHDKNAQDDILNFKQGRVTFPSNVLCRKDAFSKTFGFNPSLSNVADKMIYLDLLQHGELIHLNQFLLFYRVHKNSMHNNFELMVKDYNTMIAELKKNYNHLKLRVFTAKVYKICAAENLKNNHIFMFLYYFVKSFFLSPKIYLKLHYSKNSESEKNYI